jgi:hypothetical protein
VTRPGHTRLADVHVQSLGADARLGALPGDPLAARVTMDFRRLQGRCRRGRRIRSATKETTRDDRRVKARKKT